MFLLRRAGWVIFLALLGGCAAAWWLTESAVSTSGFTAATPSHSALPASERPLAVALALEGLADTPAENQLANQAKLIAQQLLDDALRQQAAAAGDRSHTGPLWKRLQTTQAAVQGEQNALKAFQAQLAHAPAVQKPRIQAQIQLTRAQLQLDQARLADASEDWNRADDSLSTASGLAAQQKAAQAAAAAAAHKWSAQWQQQAKNRNPAAQHGLAALIHSWRLLSSKEKALNWSRAEAVREAAAAQSRHQSLHTRIQAAESQNRSRLSGALGQLQHGTLSQAAAQQTQSVVQNAEQLAAAQRQLIGYDHAAQLQSELAQTYQRWAAIGAAQEALTLHDAAGLLLAILVGIAVLLLLDRLAIQALARTHAEHRRLHTLRHVLRFGLEVLGVVWVLLAITGSPAQWLTFLGLAGAGLTVALQDTILSFFGWFVLIGRHGLAPGDWVEINQISGEVLEITLLQTTIQEDGNWTEPGHPTGRRVLFPNSFVFTGPYVTYSTHGQWLWDEIRIPLADAATLPDLADLAKLVEQETRADAEAAAGEWKTHSPRLPGREPAAGDPEPRREDAFAPTVQIKPGQQDQAMDLSVRYITNAVGRAARRERLYRAIYAQQTAPRAAAR